MWDSHETPVIRSTKDIGAAMPELINIVLTTDSNRLGHGEWLRMFQSMPDGQEYKVQAGMRLSDWVKLAHEIIAYDISQRIEHGDD